eukprot:766404-Hanusia_phi.AAC.4
MSCWGSGSEGVENAFSPYRNIVKLCEKVSDKTGKEFSTRLVSRAYDVLLFAAPDENDGAYSVEEKFAMIMYSYRQHERIEEETALQALLDKLRFHASMLDRNESTWNVVKILLMLGNAGDPSKPAGPIQNEGLLSSIPQQESSEFAVIHPNTFDSEKRKSSNRFQEFYTFNEVTDDDSKDFEVYPTDGYKEFPVLDASEPFSYDILHRVMTSQTRPYLGINLATGEKLKALKTSDAVVTNAHQSQIQFKSRGIEGLHCDFSEQKNCCWEDMVQESRWVEQKRSTQLPIRDYECLCRYYLPDGNDQFASEDVIDEKQVLRDLKYLAFGFASAVFKGDKETCAFAVRKPCRLQGMSVLQTTSMLNEMCKAGGQVVLIEQFITKHQSTNEKVSAKDLLVETSFIAYLT